jgi:hypothetical protein
MQPSVQRIHNEENMYPYYIPSSGSPTLKLIIRRLGVALCSADSRKVRVALMVSIPERTHRLPIHDLHLQVHVRPYAQYEVIHSCLPNLQVQVRSCAKYNGAHSYLEFGS